MKIIQNDFKIIKFRRKNLKHMALSILLCCTNRNAVQPSLPATAAWPTPPGPPGLPRAPPRPQGPWAAPWNSKNEPLGPMGPHGGAHGAQIFSRSPRPPARASAKKSGPHGPSHGAPWAPGVHFWSSRALPMGPGALGGPWGAPGGPWGPSWPKRRHLQLPYWGPLGPLAQGLGALAQDFVSLPSGDGLFLFDQACRR